MLRLTVPTCLQNFSPTRIAVSGKSVEKWVMDRQIWRSKKAASEPILIQFCFLQKVHQTVHVINFCQILSESLQEHLAQNIKEGEVLAKRRIPQLPS